MDSIDPVSAVCLSIIRGSDAPVRIARVKANLRFWLIDRRIGLAGGLDQLGQRSFEDARKLDQVKRHKNGREPAELLDNVVIHPASAAQIATLAMMQSDRCLN